MAVVVTWTEQGNLIFRDLFFEHAGDVEQQHGHSHPYDHTHKVCRGSIKIEVNGQATVYTAPANVYLGAGENHKLTALEDNTWSCCVHAIRNADRSGEPIDPHSIPAGSSALPYSDLLFAPFKNGG